MRDLCIMPVIMVLIIFNFLSLHHIVLYYTLLYDSTAVISTTHLFLKTIDYTHLIMKAGVYSLLRFSLKAPRLKLHATPEAKQLMSSLSPPCLCTPSPWRCHMTEWFSPRGYERLGVGVRACRLGCVSLHGNVKRIVALQPNVASVHCDFASHNNHYRNGIPLPIHGLLKRLWIPKYALKGFRVIKINQGKPSPSITKPMAWSGQIDAAVKWWETSETSLVPWWPKPGAGSW